MAGTHSSRFFTGWRLEPQFQTLLISLLITPHLLLLELSATIHSPAKVILLALWLLFMAHTVYQTIHAKSSIFDHCALQGVK